MFASSAITSVKFIQHSPPLYIYIVPYLLNCVNPFYQIILFFQNFKIMVISTKKIYLKYT
nr:MAG TPA: hypothetical protein [Caudoviricetes sp.]